ncbi:GMP synthase subunit A [Sulfolobus acidocaldarius]|uniref:GMP synthase [glutamine-hydrolyzing] subunit A n=4 Tax=Sulfolobus acidocaldarius TaxID=2285 RepID=GUAAA_SULAC|nr:GMP synthase subunit A [Sulfolobus acidocaldarius]Q8X239.3 RecName: Full=GMP synthase [glutamine-hydrolyzing] subunit A; AltName: Full=Glutamine amidotransferase [Sulfolobus acidocaldarius DSM 639]AAY79944.1 glutamine amidotransferase class-I domain [Sulfolobus acidocaldarius DSM 639]AGE70514.1 GMP synthase subunit A [Sulfolobus acidocaldarius N8]AGE72787.1 GMP synthase subunit A [Sulfolobus acidocaldarius Ron12/I]ALU29122.1 GMP synthase [Sulfolobus acidocaldarius]ALU31848.1 GMP synthase [
MKVAVIYFGGQYNHLIVKDLKYLGLEAVAITPDKSVEELKEFDSVVFGGGPYSVINELDKMGFAPDYVKSLNVPKLGICLGHQLIAKVLGGEVRKANKPEYGLTTVNIVDEDTILRGLKPSIKAWESHNDEVVRPPSGFRILASSENAKVQAMVNNDNSIFGVQFHPEVKHTEKGIEVFKNFIKICRK